MSNLRIQDMDNTEKPREKLLNYGPETLTDTELLAIILRTGGKDCSALDLARQLVKEFGSLKTLFHADIAQLRKIKFINVAKAASIKAISEIALRSQTQQSTLGIKVKKPADLFSIVRKDLFDKPKEYLCMVCLNTKGVCVAKTIISIGTLTETLVDQREIFKTALEKNAASIALAHNHPSGDITPSENDIKVTQKVAQAGDEIGIPVVDHLIVYNDTFLSMKSKGLLKDFITQ